ncbi:hypothetical protein HHK36_000250 [Tetracentron sinense]|uniref:KIB1-4 beta-propeller domain-containing protein n=1 Tax=Tetracentron sinense TaxID=13715 RepID=A0A834ZQS2_TETSI|nr:hypothetical protein HHK36_000250 [Tetracentron sinense]
MLKNITTFPRRCRNSTYTRPLYPQVLLRPQIMSSWSSMVPKFNQLLPDQGMRPGLTIEETRPTRYYDVIYYKEKFYAVNSHGIVVVCDVQGPNPTELRIIAKMPDFDTTIYLVESAGALLVVSRANCIYFTDDNEEPYLCNPEGGGKDMGANKGIGLEICRQLASNGIIVVLRARDEKKGIQAVENLKGSGFSDVVFHRLDVMDPLVFLPGKISSEPTLENLISCLGVHQKSSPVILICQQKQSNNGLQTNPLFLLSMFLRKYNEIHVVTNTGTEALQIASLMKIVKASAIKDSSRPPFWVSYENLDLQVNNAEINGIIIDTDAVRALRTADDELKGEEINWNDISTQTYELAEECLKTNYYGTKRVTEALIPLLQLSNSARIINIQSSIIKIQKISNEKAKEVLSDVDGLTEERVDEMLNGFLKDFKENLLEIKGWPSALSAYTISKVAINGYTRILAKKFPTFCINCVCPGYVKSDFNYFTGYLSIKGAESPVRCAVVTGANKGIGLEICRQLASNGIMVVLTARDEKRAIQAVENLKVYGFYDLFFHQLDVMNPSSIASLKDFIKTHFGKLDILVNNAAINGSIIDTDAVRALRTADDELNGNEINWIDISTQTYELAEECLKTNYYGTNRLTEAHIPLLQLSNSARIINVSSSIIKIQQDID